MALNYTTYVAQLQNLMAISSASGDYTSFQTFLPGAIDYAEQRIYRELDLLATRVTDSTTQVSSGNRNFTLPTTTGTFLVVEEINIISSAGQTAASGTRNPLTFTSREFIDMYAPASTSNTGPPEYAAMVSNTAVILGPAPDGPYVAEVIGTQRPTPLASTNSSTILTQMLPDLFIAASMVFATGYQRDFGSQSDTPQASASWESQYQLLKQSANIEEVRKFYRGDAWTSKQPSPVAQPPRV